MCQFYNNRYSAVDTRSGYSQGYNDAMNLSPKRPPNGEKSGKAYIKGYEDGCLGFHWKSLQEKLNPERKVA
jgi:hypothetical protein